MKKRLTVVDEFQIVYTGQHQNACDLRGMKLEAAREAIDHIIVALRKKGWEIEDQRGQ